MSLEAFLIQMSLSLLETALPQRCSSHRRCGWAQRACARECHVTAREQRWSDRAVRSERWRESEMIRISVLCVVLSWAVLVSSQRPTPCGKNRPVGHLTYLACWHHFERMSTSFLRKERAVLGVCKENFTLLSVYKSACINFYMANLPSY